MIDELITIHYDNIVFQEIIAWIQSEARNVYPDYSDRPLDVLRNIMQEHGVTAIRWSESYDTSVIIAPQELVTFIMSRKNTV